MSIRIDRIKLSDPEGPQGPNDPGRDDDGGLGIATKTRVRTKKPSMYRVLILNDDYCFYSTAYDCLQYLHLQMYVLLSSSFEFEMRVFSDMQ